MTLHQQDKHTCKVESFFSFPLDQEPKKTGVEAGGNSGEQDVAYAMLIWLSGPRGAGGEEGGSFFSNWGLICIKYSRSAEKGHGGMCLKAVPPEALAIEANSCSSG